MVLTSKVLKSDDAETHGEGHLEKPCVPNKAVETHAGSQKTGDQKTDNQKTGDNARSLDSGDDSISLRQDAWAHLFPEPRSMRFANDVVRNPYCGDCRFCCCPQEEPEPFPMALLDSQVSSRTKDDFHLLDEHTAALDRRGCKSLGPSGCKLENHLRPIACNLFPYVLVNDRLYLYLVCPAVMFGRDEELVTIGKEVHAFLATLARNDLARISIARRPEDLALKYRDLGLHPLL